MILKHKILSCIDTLTCNRNCEVLLASPSLISESDGTFRVLLSHWWLSFTLQAVQGMPQFQPVNPVHKWLKNVVVIHCVATRIRHLQLHFWWMWIHFSTNDDNTFQLYIACESENIRSKGALTTAVFHFEVYQCEETYKTIGKTLWYNTCDKRQ